MSNCGRLTDAELVRALDAEAAAWVANEHPYCPRHMAVYDILVRKTDPKARTHDAVSRINERLDTLYDSNLYGKWRRGERPIPREAEAFMRQYTLICLFGDEGKALAQLLDGPID